MAIVPTATSQTGGSRTEASDRRELSTSPHHPGSQQSDIRALQTNNLEVAQAFELTINQGRREAMTLPPFSLEAATSQYAELTQNESSVLHALQTGDLPQAVIMLIQENFQLRKEIESYQSDFDELRSVNVAQQEQSDARLEVADDQRVELLGQLERVRGDLLELESRSEQMQLDYESQLEALRER